MDLGLGIGNSSQQEQAARPPEPPAVAPQPAADAPPARGGRAVAAAQPGGGGGLGRGVRAGEVGDAGTDCAAHELVAKARRPDNKMRSLI